MAALRLAVVSNFNPNSVFIWPTAKSTASGIKNAEKKKRLRKYLKKNTWSYKNRYTGAASPKAIKATRAATVSMNAEVRLKRKNAPSQMSRTTKIGMNNGESEP